jgi:hypothetical protein
MKPGKPRKMNKLDAAANLWLYSMTQTMPPPKVKGDFTFGGIKQCQNLYNILSDGGLRPKPDM